MKLRWHYLKHITCVQVQNVVAVSVQFSPIGIGHWSSLRHLLLLYMMLLRNFDELDAQNHFCVRYFYVHVHFWVSLKYIPFVMCVQMISMLERERKKSAHASRLFLYIHRQQKMNLFLHYNSIKQEKIAKG